MKYLRCVPYRSHAFLFQLYTSVITEGGQGNGDELKKIETILASEWGLALRQQRINYNQHEMEKLKLLLSMIKPSIRGSHGAGRCMSSDSSGGDPYHSFYQNTFMEHAAKSGINQGLSHVGDDGQVWSPTQFMPYAWISSYCNYLSIY